MPEILREVAAKVSVVTDGPSFEKAKKNVEDIKGKMESLKGAAGTGEVSEGISKVIGIVKSIFSGPLGIGVAAAGAAAGMGALAASVAKTAGEVRKSAQLTGLSTAEFQELAFAGKETGVDAGTLTHSIGKLSREMYSAANGNKEAAKTFAGLGVEVKGADGKLRPTTEVIADLAEQFAHMPNGPQKIALAMQVFGKSGAEMLPLLNKGADGIREFGHQARMLGIVIDDQTLKVAKEFSAAKKELSATWEGLKTQLGSIALPMLLDMTKSMVENLETARDLMDFNEGRFSSMGLERAAQLGPEALDRYIRIVGYGGGLAKPGTGLAETDVEIKERKRREAEKPLTPDEIEYLKKQKYGEGALGTWKENAEWSTSWFDRANNALAGYVINPASNWLGMGDLITIKNKEYGVRRPEYGAAIPKPENTSWEQQYSPWQLPTPTAPPIATMPPEEPRSPEPQAPAWSAGPAIENNVTVNVTTTGQVDPQKIASVVDEKLDERMRQSNALVSGG